VHRRKAINCNSRDEISEREFRIARSCLWRCKAVRDCSGSHLGLRASPDLAAVMDDLVREINPSSFAEGFASTPARLFAASRLWPAETVRDAEDVACPQRRLQPCHMPRRETTLAVLRAAPGYGDSSARVCGTWPLKLETIFAARPELTWLYCEKIPSCGMRASSCGRVALAIFCGVGSAE